MTTLNKPAGMTDAQFKSMVGRNGITAEKIAKAKEAVKRNGLLIEQSKMRLGK